MRYKFSSALILSIIALSVLTASAQTYWERRDDKNAKQKRKQTIVRTIDGQSEVIVTTPDQVIVRPAIRGVRPVVVRPVAPRPPVAPVAPYVRVASLRNNYDAGRNVEFYTSRNYESNRFGSVAEVARLNGYRDGAREGAKDARDGDRYDPFGEHAYKDGATGYISKYGNRDAYQQTYRQSFVRGYKESFDRYLGYDKRYW